MTAADRPMDTAVLRALGDELIRVGRRRPTAYPGSALEDSAFKILWVLVERGPHTLRDLAEELVLEQSTINRQVRAALEHGLVERYSVAGSASRPVRASATGEQAYRHDAELRGAVLADALAMLGPGRAEALVADLRAFNDALERALSGRVAGGDGPPHRPRRG